MARVAIIGAARGIGAACVTLLKARGDDVIAFDRAEVDWADRWIELDLNDADAAAAVAGRTEGTFDAIICSAGLPPRGGNATEVLRVNVLGLLSVTRALLPKLAEDGAIVVTASRAGQRWRANLEEVRTLLMLQSAGELDAFVAARSIDAARAYSLSKEALVLWSKMQVKQLMAKAQRINTVSPAPLGTETLGDFSAAFGPNAKATLARSGRAGQPEEIASVITFLASGASSWVNGQDIIVDGGMAAMLEAEAAAQ